MLVVVAVPHFAGPSYVHACVVCNELPIREAEYPTTRSFRDPTPCGRPRMPLAIQTRYNICSFTAAMRWPSDRREKEEGDPFKGMGKWIGERALQAAAAAIPRMPSQKFCCLVAIGPARMQMGNCCFKGRLSLKMRPYSPVEKVAIAILLA